MVRNGEGRSDSRRGNGAGLGQENVRTFEALKRGRKD